MANLASIARPYALAAFEYARDKQRLPAWKAFLEAAATAAKQSDMQRLLADPEFPAAKLFELFHEVLTPMLDTEQKNFLLLLSQNKRLNVLPEVADVYNTYYAALEKLSKVRVITAVEAHDDFQKKLALALAKRINCEVTLQCEVNPSIIGGAIIHMGDRVIDGSLRGKLSRLEEFLLR